MIIYFLPAIILLGIVTSYTDIKFGKIRNKHLALGIIYYIMITLGLFLFFPIEFDYLIFHDVLINFGISTFVAIMLWNIALISAGDAKLLIVYSLLVPLSSYQNGNLPFFPAIIILINTFIPFFIFYFIKILIYAPKKTKIEAIRDSLNLKKILSLCLMIFALTWPIHLLGIYLGKFSFLFELFFSNFFISIFILFLLLEIIERLIKINLTILAIIISILRLVFDPNIYSINFIGSFTLTIILFIFARFFLLQLTYKYYVKHVDIHLLKKGMIPAERIYIEDNEYKKEPAVFFSLFSQIKKPKRKDIFEIMPEGLTPKDCQTLKRLMTLGKLNFDHLKIHQTLPFAIFLFIGIIITIIFQGNAIIGIVNILN